MARRRSAHPFSPAAPTLAVAVLLTAVLLIVGSWLLPPAADAAPLDGIAAQVNEITAPAQQAVEQVVAPVTAPTTAPAAAQASEVAAPKVPKVPTAVPKAASPPAVPRVAVPKLGETATSAGEAATGIAAAAAEGANAGAADAAGEAAAGATGEAAADAPSAAGEATAASGATVESATAAAESALSAPVAAAGEGASAAGGTTASDPSAGIGSAPADGAGAGAMAPSDGSSHLFPQVPAQFVDPFIYVWPAVALLAEGPLGGFVRNWSRSVRELFEEVPPASPSGSDDRPAPADSPPVDIRRVEQPPFSWFGSPALAPFDWVGGESALLVLALFLVLGASTLAILVLSRREVGLPLFRRGNRFPWRH